MNDTPQPVDPALITYLKRLVTALTGTMILGLLVIITLFVIRFSGSDSGSGIDIPDALSLPPGTTASAYTQGNGWAAIVTIDNRIFIYDTHTGTLIREINITQNQP